MRATPDHKKYIIYNLYLYNMFVYLMFNILYLIYIKRFVVPHRIHHQHNKPIIILYK